MCGRFTLRTSRADLIDWFELDDAPELEPRYNIAPTQPVAAVRLAHESQARELVLLRWGLIPSWAKDRSIGNRMINARAESAAEKPAFRAAFKRRRCLIPSDGFYEWQKRGKQKQPYHIRMRDNQVFAFAGLWETWRDPEENVLQTCTILTTAANPDLRALHDRMPVILERDDYATWLAAETDQELLKQLLQPYVPGELTTVPVSTTVNSPRNESPECLEEVEA